MIYLSSEIEGFGHRLKKEKEYKIYFRLVLFTASAFVIFFANKHFDPRSFILVAILFLAFFLISYVSIISDAKTISHTAVEVEITDEFIDITTATFKLFFFVVAPSKKFRFLTSNIYIEEIPYKILRVHNSGYVYNVKNLKNNAYIIPDYFDPSLSVKLLNIKDSKKQS